MKKQYKTKTEIIECEVYITSDGKEFDNEHEAVDHEFKLLLEKYPNTCIHFDCTIVDSYERATYYFLKNKEVFNILELYCDVYNIWSPKEPMKYPAIVTIDHDLTPLLNIINEKIKIS